MITLNTKLYMLRPNNITNCQDLSITRCMNTDREANCYNFTLEITCFLPTSISPHKQLNLVVKDLGRYFSDCDDILEVTTHGIYLWTHVSKATKLSIVHFLNDIYSIKYTLLNEKRRVSN